ncbi:DegT/DnrJ/EryC1/StrS family aminotransferase [Pseudodesulfovibrio portus]|uniref:Pyridoxal phosphate-dependent aminotransferase n=1 Tax=Pseudodesulfovibrio portus TaxID=231439 RepID=A0ABN6RUB7_9BACT|nr:DegT/DnrJ/EryC1/StrS family aminotransferase [Pseudodesulfovibrio portus]BDQ34692.1 pyridoxal phosphate-dependent aminotransferase [Pseudodesulfovibrio portus]
MYDIPLIKPFITDKVRERVLAVLDSGYLTEGPVTREFEERVAHWCGVDHCLAVTSCTTGLELGLRALGVGPGDEVIVPDYTYPATASVVSIVGAVPVIVDVDPQTMLIDCDALEAAITDRTRGVIPVSLFGNPLDWDRLNAIKERHSLFMLEDAACALGSSYKGMMTGSHADIAVFSHHPRKFITTGEGGTVTTRDGELHAFMHSYKHFGMETGQSRAGTQFSRIGTNYKMSNLLAAVGLEQIALIHELLAERRSQADRYLALLADVPGVSLPKITEGGEHSWQTFSVFVENRDAVMAAMREQGIEAQIGTYSLHMHPAYGDNGAVRIHGSMDGSRYAFEHALALPLYHGMTEAEQDRVVAALAGLAA